MSHQLDDLRIAALKPLIPPLILMEELPASAKAVDTVRGGRKMAADIIEGRDQRLLVVVGPCSIHNVEGALEYADRLQGCVGRYGDDLGIMMRVYFEKPRTTVGWKGLINDPHLDGSFDINQGLRRGRRLLLDLAELGLPAASEFLDTITPQFIADLVAWGAIGARTAESQVHRELASGLSMPVGIKNGTEGSVQVAIDAVEAARHPHHFLSVTKEGTSAIVTTRGNTSCHVILRGSKQGANYGAEVVGAVADKLVARGLPHRVMVDCSHGNSQKDYTRQGQVARRGG